MENPAIQKSSLIDERPSSPESMTSPSSVASAEDQKGNNSLPETGLKVDIPEEGRDIEKKEELIYRLGKMRGWKSFLFLGIGVPACLLTPAVVLIYKDRNYLPTITPLPIQELVAIPAQVVRFSLWLGLSWFTYIMSWFTISLLPGLITRFFTIFRGSLPTDIRDSLHYIPALQPVSTYLITSLVSMVGFRFFFFQMGLVPWWSTVFLILEMCSIFASVFFLQRVFIHKLANDLHQ